MMRHAILAEDIREEEAIPSVRHLSVEYGVNPQTVLKATQDLILEELIEKRRGLGMFVKKGAVKVLREQQKNEFLKKRLPELIKIAKVLGFTRSELNKEIDQLLKGE